MKTRIFLIAATLCCFFLTQRSDAQISSVNYQLKYDTVLCRYDAYIIINSGSATTIAQRTQFNAQYTLVVPTGTTLTVAASHMPLQNNQTYGGTVPLTWQTSSIVDAPAAQPESKFISIVPVLSPAAQYNNISSGDTIKLFSFTVSSIVNCGSGIRIFENGSDPTSSDAGMGGSDFSNGFTIGGTSQLYNANSTQLFPPSPVIVSATTTCSNGIEIDLTARTTSCQTPLTYAWTGPNSYTSTTQDVSIIPSTMANVGDYEVIVTDAKGCRDSITVTATNKPDAGVDQSVCAGTTATIQGANPTSGTWSAQTGNPAGATLSLLPAGAANVTFSNASSGNYNFIYSTTSCSDTMRIVVNAKPTVSVTGGSSLCIGSTTTLSPTSGGTWVSNNPSVATVSGNTVTAVAQGSATFTFTSSATGCSSTTSPVTVNPKPTVAVTGTAAVCIGSTTTLTPTTGGTWLAVFPAIATVTNGGIVTGVSAGTGRFVFTETATGCKSDTLNVTVTAKPTVSITGPTSICVLTTTQLSPASGGTWASSNPAIATVNNSGVVTGLTAGSVTFTWTETATGCTSDPTGAVTVVARPTVTASPPTICVGSTTTLSPTTGGTWVSNNPAVATITNGGVVTGVAQGSTTFTFTNTTSGCSNTTGAITVNPRPTVIAASPNICIGSTTALSPSTGGTWVSLSTGVATVTTGGVVTGVSAGTATMRFTETATGCTNTVDITVTARPTVSITGSNDICVGFTTTLSPTTGGTWASSNPAVATVSNAGLVTGISVGTATFTFTETATGCNSLPTGAVTIRNKPVVSITGPTAICVGFTTSLSVTPANAGTWTSSNPSVATVHATTGVVTAVSAGSATFTFTETGGCTSNATAPVTVNILPVVSFTGPSTICVGFTTTLSPTTGGTWASSAPGVATVTNAGLVTGISAGSVTFTFTETATGCTSAALSGTISPKPTVTLTGPSPICIDSTTTLSPTTGGTWVSSAPSVASITNAGLVTGLAQGTAIFTFTSTAGCASDPIISVAIMPRPTVNITGPSGICIGGTTTLSPSSGGTWVSSDPSVATVTNGGVVTGVSSGIATFTFTSSAGCQSLATGAITVNPKPVTVVNGPSSICVGATTNISPTTGGTWVSTNPAIATITNAGIITGVSVGSVRFIFTQTSTGCISDTSSVVTVTTGPTVSVTGDTELCIGETSTLSPSTGGTWTSSNVAIATVTNGGVVTAVAQGTATFRFRLTSTGCLSDPTTPITVNGRPTVSVTGSTSVCIGGTTQLSPSTGGTWVSSNNAIATVTNGGLVTGQAVGSATFTFTLSATGCSSLATEPVTVTPSPIASISGPDNICVGGTTTLSPSTGGVWTSSDPTIATVTNGGVVTSIGPGKVTFMFTETATGCASASSTGTLTITHCFNPDFNATFVNVLVPGDVSTNDNINPDSTSYGPTASIVLMSSPSGSIPNINILPDGTYTFITNKAGVYVFEVPVCINPTVSGCPRSELTINVRDNLDPVKMPIANVDIAVTPKDVAVTLNTLANDRCVVITGCTLDSASVVVIDNPNHGAASVNTTTGEITYTPSTGFIGMDTLIYKVCVSGEATNCATAKQIITVIAPSADNTTDAADDFAVTAQNTAVSGNVKDNDTDPEGDNQTVTAYSSTVAAGTLVLNSDGSYTFTPVSSFYGPVEFVYETIDDNTTPDTAYATLHILVVQDLTIKVRVYLEGALMNNSNATAADGRPLMRDNLRVSPFNGTRYIPDNDPYRSATTYINVTSKFTKVAPGDRSEFLTVSSPSTVFGVTGQNAIVDWVFVELRSKTTNTTVLATRSGLLQRDGDVVDLDGVSGLRFPGIVIDNYYVTVRHHKHLGAMTKFAQTPTQLTTLVNFTVSSTPVFDFGTTKNNGYDYTGLAQKSGVKLGYMALWAGDFDSNRKVKADNPNDDLNNLFFDVSYYPNNGTFNANYDFAYGYLPGDYDMNSKSKFDNPNDDKNMLYGQLLFYPLNTALLSNFDFFIEQLPTP